MFFRSIQAVVLQNEKVLKIEPTLGNINWPIEEFVSAELRSLKQILELDEVQHAFDTRQHQKNILLIKNFIEETIQLNKNSKACLVNYLSSQETANFTELIFKNESHARRVQIAQNQYTQAALFFLKTKFGIKTKVSSIKDTLSTLRVFGTFLVLIGIENTISAIVH